MISEMHIDLLFKSVLNKLTLSKVICKHLHTLEDEGAYILRLEKKCMMKKQHQGLQQNTKYNTK